MKAQRSLSILTGTMLLAASPRTVSAAVQLPPDIVAGNLIQFNDNGNWTWFSDERSVVDTANGRIIVGSDGNGAGMGGSARNGAIEASLFDLQSRAPKRYTMLPSGVHIPPSTGRPSAPPPRRWPAIPIHITSPPKAGPTPTFAPWTSRA